MPTASRSAFRPDLALVAAALALGACSTDAPTGSPGASGQIESFTVTAAAHQAALGSTHQMIRIFPTIQRRTGISADLVASASTIHSPLDLSNQGGSLMRSGKSWNVFVNCGSGPAACWGSASLTPTVFLTDLARSRMIHVVDQYFSNGSSSSFPFFGGGTPSFTASELSTDYGFDANTATIDDVLSIVFAAYQHNGNAGGYTNIYHIFLPAGTDMCEAPGICYSPDNFDTFYFCAFHGSVDFGGGRHALFSVEPYQAVNGCQTHAETRVIDATASTLAHEFFETITDPDGDGWWNTLTGEEIADLCVSFENSETMGANTYVVQSMYSNKYHGCADTP